MERRDFSIAEHVEAISTRTHREGTGLSRRLVGHAWPGGALDTSERAALPWLSRWHPARAATEAIACACATGHCQVCN
jgi:hypothetical protein